MKVLRATGVRVEELLEITHHSLVQYRLPSTGELVPLLQITPSKTDSERLLVISPELADVLSTITQRVRDPLSGAVPLVRAYDRRERTGFEGHDADTSAAPRNNPQASTPRRSPGAALT